MWQNWVNGILGLWVILMAFLGFSASMSRILLIISGLVIAVLGFWAASSGSSSESPTAGGNDGASGEMPDETI